MRILTNTNQAFANRFLECMKSYNSYYWLIAFATAGNEECSKTYSTIYNTLLDHKDNISKMYVGLMNYITGSDFIDEFADCPNVDFVKSKSPKAGIHSKCYWFYNSDDDWCAFVGSANLTEKGFTSNVEVMMEFSSKDHNAQSVLNELNELFFNFYKKYGSTFNVRKAAITDLKQYKEDRKKNNMLR